MGRGLWGSNHDLMLLKVKMTKLPSNLSSQLKPTVMTTKLSTDCFNYVTLGFSNHVALLFIHLIFILPSARELVLKFKRYFYLASSFPDFSSFYLSCHNGLTILAIRHRHWTWFWGQNHIGTVKMSSTSPMLYFCWISLCCTNLSRISLQNRSS